MKKKLMWTALIVTLLAVMVPAISVRAVTSITITADPDTLLTGESTTLTAEDELSNDVTSLTTFEIVEDGAGGSWVDNVYTCEVPGVWTINGTYDDGAGTVLWDTTTITVHSLTVLKELVGGSETPPQFVPINTAVWFDLMVTVTNPTDSYGVDLTQVMLQDGIGADLDLVVQNDGIGDYIFTVDGTKLYFDSIDDNAFYGQVGDVSWKQASSKAFDKNKRCADIITWNIGTLADGASVTLAFRVQTNTFTVGKGASKQSYTSTCHHELNSGPEVYYYYGTDGILDMVKGEPLVVSAYNPDGVTDTDGDGFTDLVEVAAGTDPCDPEDHPLLALL